MTIYEKLTQMIREEQERLHRQYDQSVKSEYSDGQYATMFASLDIMAEQLEMNSDNNYLQRNASSISDNMYQAARQVQSGLNEYFAGVIIGTPETAKQHGDLLYSVGSVVEAYEDAKFLMPDSNEKTR